MKSQGQNRRTEIRRHPCEMRSAVTSEFNLASCRKRISQDREGGGQKAEDRGQMAEGGGKIREERTWEREKGHEGFVTRTLGYVMFYSNNSL